ncbi:MAG: serine O-acetyltransferase [Rhodospirillales bacterium]
MFFKRFKEDVDAFMARDPAARSRLEIALCYPGLHALYIYRFSHWLWQRRFRLVARFVSHLGRLATGIEIHPGASIGRRFVIDHGQGVVIGETTDIEDDVTLYQGVTLGGISPAVDSRAQVSVKRHPTLKSGVIVGSGAQVLGPITIGEGARIGANSVVTREVAPGLTAVGIPAHVVLPKDRSEVTRFSAYGTPAGGCPDPVEVDIDNLRAQMSGLLEEVEDLRERLQALEVGRTRAAAS